MNRQGLHYTILDLLSEDDYGLWEIAWRAASVRPSHESAPSETVRTHTENAILDLLDEGLIALYLQAQPARLFRSVNEASRRLLRDQRLWEAPRPDLPALMVSATAAGEEAYYRQQGGS